MARPNRSTLNRRARASTGSRTEIIAHRGASHEAPENTLAAIRLAWQQGADAVEIDIHQTRDRHLVAIHDATTRKTAGLHRQVRATTLDALKRLDVGKWKHRRWTGERIPTLAEVLSTIPASRRLFVEVKCSMDCLPELVGDLRRSGLKPQQVVLIGFDLATLRLIKWALPRHEVCWVVAFRRSRRRWSPSVASLIRKVQHAGLDGIDAGAQGPINARFARAIHEAGLKLYVWTVDDPVVSTRLAQAGVNGITTNRPLYIRGNLDVHRP